MADTTYDNPYGLEVGQKVVYRPPHLSPMEPGEEGVITKIGASFVYVRYGDDTHSKATLYAAIHPIDPIN